MQVTYEISNNIYRLFSSQRQKYRVALTRALQDLNDNFELVKEVKYKRNTNKLAVTYFDGARTLATERAFFNTLEHYYKTADELR